MAASVIRFLSIFHSINLNGFSRQNEENTVRANAEPIPIAFVSEFQHVAAEIDLHWTRLGDERVEKQKTRCFARTSRQRRRQSRNRSPIPRRDIAAREDRTFL